jgi:hypothetical protein
MDPKKMYNKISEASRNLTRHFIAAPFSTTLKLLGILLLLQAILSFLPQFTPIGASFAMDPVSLLAQLILAFVLLSGHVTRFIIGLFLLFVFFVSIGFLIFPIDQVATVVRTSLGVDDTTIKQLEKKFDNVAGGIFYAQYQLKGPNSKGAVKAQGSEPILNTLDHTTKDLAALREYALQIIKPVAPTESALPAWVRPVLENAERVLRIGAPFIFSMLLGALGSSIVITQQFITNYEGQRPAWYLYRLIQGMTIALLMVYGLAAGILSLGGQQQPIDFNNFEQNKFFIGFFSALAGLFSENAFSKLQDLSRTLFGLAKPGEKGGDGETPAARPTKSKSHENKE